MTDLITNQNLNVLIVDDEREACLNLQRMLTEFIDGKISIAGTAHNTRDAEARIAVLKPDAVFLDIDMPGENAFQFLARIGKVPFEVVFVTAYDAYAVKAFRLNAVDYILKPVDVDELERAVVRLRERLAFKKVAGISYDALAAQMDSRREQSQIILRDNHTSEVVAFSNILYAEAMGSYARVVFRTPQQEERSMVLSHSIAEYEELFPARQFFRVHRSFLVNCACVRELLRVEESLYVVLHNKTRLPVSRRRYTELVAFLKQKAAV